MTTTTTIEKLFSQILDRKFHIIDQAKQQADSYSQHLASKLLIDGITPPPWLWNPSFAAPSSSDPKEFKKEELLSELLLPHSRPAKVSRGGFCSLFNPPTVLEGKEVEARVFGGADISNEVFNLEHGPPFFSSKGNEIGFTINASEQDVGATFLQGETEVSTLDIVTEVANEEVPEGLSFESLVPDTDSNVEDKSTPLPEVSYNDVGCAFSFAPELDQSVVSPQGQNEARILTSIPDRDLSLSRLQRSKSRQKALELRRTAEKAVSAPQADTNASDTCYNQGNIFNNASNQQLHHQDGALSAPEAQEIGEGLSKEKDATVYTGRIKRSKKICNLLADDSESKLGNSLYAAEVDVVGRIRPPNNSVDTIAEHVHLSNASSRRVTSSNSCPSGKFPLNYLNSHGNRHTQKEPSSEFIPCLPEDNNVAENKASTDDVVGTEVVLVGPDEPQAGCLDSKLDSAGPTIVSPGFDSRPSSKSKMIVKPKTLVFDEMGKISLIEANSPMEEKQNLDISLEKRCDPAESPASLGKVTRSNSSKKSTEKQSVREDISDQVTEIWMDSNETCLDEKRCDPAESPASLGKVTRSNSSKKSTEKQSVREDISDQVTEIWMDSNETCLDKRVIDDHVTESSTSKNDEDISDVDVKIRNSNALQEKQTRPPSADGDVDTLMYPKEEEISLPNQQVHKPDGCTEIIRGDTTPVLSCIADSNACQATSSRRLVVNEGNSSTLDSVHCHVEENQNIMILDSGVDGDLTSSGSVLLNELLSVRDGGFVACDAVDSLDFDDKIYTSSEIRQLKFLEESSMQGKKLRSDSENTWPQRKRRKIENFGGSSINRNLNNIGPNSRTAALQFECIPSSHKESVAQSVVNMSPDVELHSNSLTQETGLLQEMPIEQDGACFSFDTSSLNSGDAKDLPHLEDDIHIRNNDELFSYRTFLETKPYAVEDGIHPSFPIVSVQDKYLGTSPSDQTIPEFEGFIIGGEDSGERHTVRDSFDHMNLPTTSVERASLLEQLCKSAVKHTPAYRFSATKKFHRTPDVYQSASNEVLELLDSKITSNLNSDGFQKIGASDSYVDGLEEASQGMYSDGISFSDNGRDQSLKPPISPVSKLWGRISSQSFSSERKLSSNPELSCFTIEEDPSISEEQEEKEEVTTNSSQEDICSTSLDCGDKRDPLTDITRANINLHQSESVANKSQDSSSLESVDIESSFTGTRDGAKKKLGKRPSSKRINTNETKKKLNLSTSTNSIGFAKESLKNRLRQSNSTRKTSLRKGGGESVSGRESKHNNIVSNISSFVPLVQQKQAATVITGKRDVKVKALEAAEAAKRLEEKKENERKLKREALKHEKARLEEEKLRQAELKRKMKEEELKKKEADAAARKRQREEEEKKERERKRRRFEGKRQQQKEQEEKFWARKLEKKLPVGAADAKLNSETVIVDALQKPQKVKVDENKEGNNVKKSNAEFMADVRQSVLEGFGRSRVSVEVNNTSREKSYDISPYQSSDEDDEDEDDEISPKKFVPTWASKNSLALIVSSQQDIDPDTLFPLESFCSVDEISGLGVYMKK